MPRYKPFNLFVYGTLMDPSVFRAVLGKRLVAQASDADGVNSFLARDAVLEKYKKISPDNTYLYAMPDPHGRIRGYLIGPLPGQAMAGLLKYEGRNYSRKRVEVRTPEGPEQAVAFVANVKQLEHSFGYAFRDPFKQEIILREKIESALVEAEREKLHTDEPVTRRAVGELFGATIRDLVRRHFEAGGISDYAIRRSLSEMPLRDFTRILSDGQAAPYASHYLAMVMRQVVFNQIEEKIQKDFRFELDQLRLGTHYYERTVSSLAALRVLGANRMAMSSQVANALESLDFSSDHLVSYVRQAIQAADAIYDARGARAEVDYIASHMNRGAIPLGAELEFSNVGHAVIRDPLGKSVHDERYDGFLYFGDFALDVLTWKLGGHIDDHHEKASRRPRRGFFEIALGSLSIEANLSKPITDDPWLLNQFMHEARQFFDIAPHSVHISLQLRTQHRPRRDRLLPLGDLQCLFALGGDPRRGEDDRPRIQRLVTEEIVRYDPPPRGKDGPLLPRMLFSEISKRHSSDATDLSPLLRGDRQATTGNYVQQFKFLRLAEGVDYESIALALKGLQLRLLPGTFLTPSQYAASPKHRQTFHELMRWGAAPTAIGEGTIDEFLSHVHEGLKTERRGKAAHRAAYIAWSMSQLRTMLRKFDEFVGAV